MTGDVPASGGEIYKEFLRIVVTSPVAVITLVLSNFMGYGISFVLFDYRRSLVQKSHYLFHVSIGLGYAAVVFLVVNHDLVSYNLTVDQIAQRMPLTLLISFGVAFLVMLCGAILRDRYAPYSREGAGGNRH